MRVDGTIGTALYRWFGDAREQILRPIDGLLCEDRTSHTITCAANTVSHWVRELRLQRDATPQSIFSAECSQANRVLVSAWRCVR